MQKALQRIQIIAANAGSDDVVATQNNGASGATGGDYGQKNLDWLVGTLAATYIPEETNATTANPACDSWDPLKILT
ncbi:MAG: hypothetical protein R3A45_01055 [Bdellovibrionota bacterium]